MSGRDAVLGAVRRALAHSPEPAPHTPAYRRHGDMAAEAQVERFLGRLGDYDVHVTVVAGEADIAAAVAARLSACGKTQVAVPRDLPPAWRPAGVEILVERELDARRLGAVPASLTGCALAVAETGSIVLDGGDAQGRRVLTLLPDHHLCVVFADQLVESLPEALQRLAPAAHEGRPLTFVSGPSATADIEFERVVGVHGPRLLDVFFVRAGPRASIARD